MVDNPAPSDPPPAIEAVIAEMPDKALREVVENAVTFLRSIDWLTREAEESAFDLAESLDAALALRPHPSPPPDAIIFSGPFYDKDGIGNDAGLSDLTRAVMQRINASSPGARLAEVPTLFAFGPIYDALATAYGAGRPDAPPQGIAALIADMREIQMVAGQCGADSNRPGAIMAAAESDRCRRWADRLEALAASPRPSPAGTKEKDGAEFVGKWRILIEDEAKSSPAGTREEKGTEG